MTTVPDCFSSPNARPQQGGGAMGRSRLSEPRSLPVPGGSVLSGDLMLIPGPLGNLQPLPAQFTQSFCPSCLELPDISFPRDLGFKFRRVSLLSGDLGHRHFHLKPGWTDLPSACGRGPIIESDWRSAKKRVRGGSTVCAHVCEGWVVKI